MKIKVYGTNEKHLVTQDCEGYGVKITKEDNDKFFLITQSNTEVFICLSSGNLPECL